MKERLIKIKNWFSNHAPTKRRLIQVYSALLFNANLKGYISGRIFKGETKNLCTPGLNCYSCPGAVTACPLGALQNAFSASGKSAPYYMLGIILLYSIMFGRWICGWLCPFGLVQDLLHKIKTPKIKKGRITKILSYFKYVLLVVFVIVLPLIYVLRDLPLPAFCKYICPAGTFGGALGLLINPANEATFGMLGPLFTWKFALMVSFLVGAVFIYRIFCRFFCPLGALYGIFNKIALFGIRLDKKSCIDCGKCITKCKMDITTVGDKDCIHCGDCIEVCPTNAISWRGSKIFLPKNEFEAAPSSDSDALSTDESIALAKAKAERFKKNSWRAALCVLSAILIAALVYFNFLAPADDPIPPPETEEDGGDETVNIPTGSRPGYKCPTYSLELIDGSGEINVKDLRGKVVVINFWGVWCTPCKAELPHFNEVASEYDGEVVVLTVHSVQDRNGASAYIQQYFPNSKMLFAYDEALTVYSDKYFTTLGGTDYYPRTLVLDKDGIITFTKDGDMEKAELVSVVEAALAK